MYIDWYYIALVLPAVLLSMIASAFVNSTFKKYSKIKNISGVTGAEAARMVLASKGIYNVMIQPISGDLTDHYNPKTNIIYLSESVYNSATPSAVGVAAHEAGHAVQHAENYLPVKIRTAIVPITNFGASISTILLVLGLILSYYGSVFIVFAYLGVALFGLTTVFQLVTLPTEFNASKRAMIALRDSGHFSNGELSSSKKVLTAAAMTYVAALAVSAMQLLRLLLIVRNNDRRN